MSKKQAVPAAGEGPALVEVRALISNPAHGLVAGALAEIPADSLAALKAAGVVDDHPDAVAFARGAGV